MVKQVVLLAGGKGTRMREMTESLPKPMVEIGGIPVLQHLMNIFNSFGDFEYVVSSGYKSEIIEKYFKDYSNVKVVNTGEETMTGGRIRRISDYIKDESHFCVTYGDGVGNINISESINFHKAHKKIATLTSTYPSGRFGALDIKDSKVCQFKEKPRGDGAKINGGFFVFSKNILNYIDGDNVILEQEPLQTLAHEGQLMAFEHEGFWQPMDTMRDKNMLDQIWDSGDVPWKIWN